MHIQEAINLVQAKFMAESKGETAGEAADKYQDAFSEFPVLMEVATYIFAQGLITQNYHAALRKAQEEQGKGAGPGSGQGGAGGGTPPIVG
jgi:hypothetical protein